MPCYGPLTAYYSKELNPTGKRSLVFNPKASHSGVPIKLPCGQCFGCRLEHSRMWAMRCMNEKRVCNGDSSFVTLTYDDAHLYEIWQEKGCSTLVREHPQLFTEGNPELCLVFDEGTDRESKWPCSETSPEFFDFYEKIA